MPWHTRAAGKRLSLCCNPFVSQSAGSWQRCASQSRVSPLCIYTHLQFFYIKSRCNDDVDCFAQVTANIFVFCFQTLIRWFSKKDKLILTMRCVTRRRGKEKYYLRASMTSELRLPRSDSVDILKGWSADLLHAAWRGNNCMWSNAAWPASSLFWYSLANLH